MEALNRTVQLIELEILKIFIDICEKNNFRYYIIGGSLIGVLRHKGFIPWDDDIDIGMPREDYEKFLKISVTELPKGYMVSNHRTDPNWYFGMSQLVDKETEIDIYMTEIPRRCHVWIDLFPLDGLPANGFLRKLHIWNILLNRFLIQMAKIETQVDTHKVGRPLYEKIIISLLKKIRIGDLINCENVLKRLNKTLRKIDYDKSTYAGNMLGKYREREAVPKAYFGHPEKFAFEDILVNVPEKYHELQSTLYGDYMKMPSEDKRVSHDIKFVKLRK